MGLRFQAVACVMVSLLAGCEEDRTEVIVVVDSDLRVPGELDLLEIDVQGPDSLHSLSMATLGDDQPPLPRTLGLVWEAGPLGPFHVTVTATHEGGSVGRREARFFFRKNRTLELPMHIVRSCQGSTCGFEETCTETGCRSFEIGPDELAAWDGEPSRLMAGGDDAGLPGDDAGPEPMDGGADAGETTDAGGGGMDACGPEICNMADDDCDGRSDEDFDTRTDVMNCGSCGNVCNLPNATSVCRGGNCNVDTCNAGFDNCDGARMTGCEANLMDPSSCGMCLNVCMGATPMCCTGGTCMATCM